MVSRDDNTRLYMYTTTSDGSVVEFEVQIPAGYIVFFRGDSLVHAGSEYREPQNGEDPEDRNRTRVFGYVQGWAGQHYELMDATGDWSVETICAQQSTADREVNPTLYKGDSEVETRKAH